MKKNKVLVFGSKGLVGKSLVNTLNSSEKVENVFASTRKILTYIVEIKFLQLFKF